MVTKFKVAHHSLLTGGQMVEVWRDGVFVAGIYPHQDGIRIVSKYMTEVNEEPAYHAGQWVSSAIVKLLEVS